YEEGRGKFGTYDLQGNIFNATQDDSGDPHNGWLPPPAAADCTHNCSTRPPAGATFHSGGFQARGISYLYPDAIVGPVPPVVYGADWSHIINGRSFSVRNTKTPEVLGFRCA